MEQWRNVVGYNGKYLVSNEGRVKNAKSGRILKEMITHRGYVKVHLFRTDDEKNIFLHRIVADEFIPNPQRKPQVNHIDGNKLNNNADNLEWCTGHENVRHSWENGLREGNVQWYRSKMKKVVAISIDGTDVIRFNSIAEAKKHFNTNHVSDVLNGHREQTKGYRFLFDEEEVVR